MKQITQYFQALSDESRIRIMNLLFAVEELCVCDIQTVLDISQPKASRHLAYLKHAGLVDDKRKGLWMIYSLHPPEDEVHNKFLQKLREICFMTPELQHDLEILNKTINTGCCAIFRNIYPDRKRSQVSSQNKNMNRTSLSPKRNTSHVNIK